MARQSHTTVTCALLTLILSGCSGLTEIQDTTSKFDQGAHSVSTTEMAFLKSAQTLDCKYQFYVAAFTFVNDLAPIPNTPLSVATKCAPRILPDADIETRQKLMDSITLYADQIQAIASAGTDKSLSTNEQALAGNINSLAKSNKLIGTAGLPIAAAVEAAVIGLTDMVLEEEKFNDIRSAAVSESANLTEVVSYLRSENSWIADNMNSKAGSIGNILDTEIAKEKTSGNPNLLPNIFLSWSIYHGENYAVTVNVKQLNDTLESLVEANNNAIAAAGVGGIKAAVNDLVARAQAAQAMQAALEK